MNGTITYSIAGNSFKSPRIFDRLKFADKFKINNENTALSEKYAKVNHDDFLDNILLSVEFE